MGTIILIAAIVAILAFGFFRFRKGKKFFNDTVSTDVTKDGKGFTYPSDRKLSVRWNPYNNPSTGGETPSYYNYSLQTENHRTNTSDGRLNFYFKAQVLEKGQPVSAYIKAGNIYAKDENKNLRKLGYFYPGKNAPKAGWYLGANTLHEIKGSVDLSELKEDEDIFWEATSVTIL